MITRAIALSYEAMQCLVATQPEVLANNVFISILHTVTTPEQRIFPDDTQYCITLFYEDVTSKNMQAYLNMRGEERRRNRHMSIDNAMDIVRFLKHHHRTSAKRTLYVNCAAGISRSGAIVTFAAGLCGLDKEQLATDNPNIDPNSIQLGLLRHCLLESQ